MLSTKTKYGVKAVIQLARSFPTEKVLPIAALAEAERIPLKFLEAILLDLKNAGLLNSKRGPGGGYYLARKPYQISLAEVVRVLNGPLAPIRCVSATAHEPCDECLDIRTCALRMVMNEVRNAMVMVMENVTLEDMVRLSDQAGRDYGVPVALEELLRHKSDGSNRGGAR